MGHSEKIDYNPTFVSLEDLAERDGPMIHEFFFELLDDGDSVINENLELENLAFGEYVKLLIELINPDLLEDIEAYAVGHRAMFVSLTLVDYLQPGPASLRPSIYLDELTGLTRSEIQTKLKDDAIEYFQGYTPISSQGRPHLKNLVDTFMPEIDPSAQYTDIAETIAALTFMQVENHALGRDEEVRVALADLSLFAEWDGIAPDFL